jgi:hypothetical protein
MALLLAASVSSTLRFESSLGGTGGRLACSPPVSITRASAAGGLGHKMKKEAKKIIFTCIFYHFNLRR